jgi:putative DNA primase/helicase
MHRKSPRFAAILRGLNCEVSVIDAKALASIDPNGGTREPTKGWDAADAIVDWQGLNSLRNGAEGFAAGFENGEHEAAASGVAHAEVDWEIQRLAALPDIQYERERKTAAQRLGVRTSILDKLVSAERGPTGNLVTGGRPLELTEPEPWPESVDGAALLDEIEVVFRSFVICEPAAAVAVSLWIAATWFADHVKVAPIANIRSPEPRCGKTTVLDFLSRVTRRPLTAANISASAIFRTIEKFQPALLIDEADAFFGRNDELRGVINSGHSRQSAYVVRTVGDDHELQTFSTWGFKAIAGIGRRTATVEDRSITIALKRKLPGEKVDRLHHAEPGLFESLARKLARFAQDHDRTVAAARPEMPNALNDRQQDNWEPLLAIADVAGGHWPQKTREASLAMSGRKAETGSITEELLTDIRSIFDEHQVDRLPSETLVGALVAMPDCPWAEANKGRAITQNWLARRLHDFAIARGLSA